jgi:hypothetical protein
MNNVNKINGQPKRLWPWFVLAGFLLGILLTILWLSWEIKRVKRIRESTAGQAGIAPGPLAPPIAGWLPRGFRDLPS